MKKQQAGFTLIELVVVILVLSILGATALPRFMNVTSDAYKAAVAGAGGGLGSGIALAHAQWVANGSTGATANVAGFGDGTVDVNTNGWPVGTNNTTMGAAQDCVEVWNGVMQNPPSASTAAGSDYLVTLVGGGVTCRYTFQPSTTPARRIDYNSNNGAVTVTNP